MRIEYLAGAQPQIEHIAETELHRWTAEHPQAIIVHATPEPDPDGRTPSGNVGASGTPSPPERPQAGW